MAANLLIGYPDIMLRGTVTSSPGTASGYSATDVISGPRANLWKANASATGHAWVTDLGASTTASVTYAILDRAPLAYKPSGTGISELQLFGSSDGVTWGSALLTLTARASTVAGPQSDIVVSTVSTTSAFRYWKANLRATDASSILPGAGKIYFGSWFDFGSEPVAPLRVGRNTSGAHNRESTNTFILTWAGVSNATAQSFIDKILKIKDTAIFYLYAPTYTGVLTGFTVLPVYIQSAEITADFYNRNTVTVNFEESV